MRPVFLTLPNLFRTATSMACNSQVWRVIQYVTIMLLQHFVDKNESYIADISARKR